MHEFLLVGILMLPFLGLDILGIPASLGYFQGSGRLHIL